MTDDTLLGDYLVDDQEPSPVEQVDLSFFRSCLENAMASELVPYERDRVRLRLGFDDGVSRTVPQIVEEYGGASSYSEVRSAESRAYKTTIRHRPCPCINYWPIWTLPEQIEEKPW